MKTITIHVESEPHDRNLDNVLLNRPAPTGGAFLIDARVERPTWERMKAAGAWYLDEEYLEEMDMFQSSPGWRYNLEAIAALVDGGYELFIRDQVVQTREQLLAMFTAEGKEAYRERVRQERAQAEREREEAKERRRAEREAAGIAYQQWMVEHLSGLTYLSQRPAETLDWSEVARFSGDTPGAWYDGGDRWDVANVDGAPVYRFYYGNAVKYYAPETVAERWHEAAWQASTDGSAEYKTPGQAALWALGRVADGAVCYGDDLARWAVERIGERALVEQAMAEAPVRSNGPSDGLASKIYRIPVRERVYSLELAQQTNHRPGESYLYPVGYGSYTLHRPSYAVGYVVPAEELAADNRQMRLYGWVPLGEEETGEWPTAEDIAEIQQGNAESAARFSALFAG